MIKTGRPAFHIKAHWISIEEEDGITFYQLDSKGQISKIDGKIIPHHKEAFQSQDNELTKQSNSDLSYITTNDTDSLLNFPEHHPIDFEPISVDYKMLDIIDTEFPDNFFSLEQESWFF